MPPNGAAMALKVTVVAPAGTESKAGTVTMGLVLDTSMEMFPARTGCERVMVQEAAPPGLILFGLQTSEEMRRLGEATNVNGTDLD